MNSERLTTSVLFIDGNKEQRVSWVEGLKSCSPHYRILEADSGHAGLAIHSTQRVDCVILELDLPDLSGFEVLGRLIPIPKKPNVAVVGLTRLAHRGLFQIAHSLGMYVCFYKPHTSPDDLDRAINLAIGFVGQMPKEYPYRAHLAPSHSSFET